MNRIDWVIVRRLLGSIGLTLAVLYGLILLVESLSTSRFMALTGWAACSWRCSPSRPVRRAGSSTRCR